MTSSETQGEIVGSWESRSRQVYKNERASPWDSSLNRPVTKPIKILVCDWAQKFFCGQSESSLFLVTRLSWLLFRRCSPTNCLIACSDRLFVIMLAWCKWRNRVFSFQQPFCGSYAPMAVIFQAFPTQTARGKPSLVFSLKTLANILQIHRLCSFFSVVSVGTGAQYTSSNCE